MTASKIVTAAASGAGSSTTDVDDVFSSHTFLGNGSSQVITNNVDLTEGGMVWVKTRSHAAGGGIVDTETGASKYLLTNSTAAQVSGNSSVTAFNNNGFTVGSSGTFNESNYEYASWTFRKAEKFFDIVTYTGDSQQGRQIAHNLGSVPGMIWIKILSGGTDHWTVYHRGVTDSDPHDYRLRLNNNTEKHDVIVFNDTAPTSTHFTVSGYSEVNSSGKTYVAYIFAHNNNDGEFGPDSDQDIIKCGQFETSNNSNRQDVDLGFEPQFVLLKNVTNTTSGDWYTMDEIRGMTGGDGNDTSYLAANSSNQEYDFGSDTFYKYGSGFGVVNNAFATNVRFVYMAIRRGPLSPPDSVSEVFNANAYTGNGTANRKFTTNFQVDANLTRGRGNTYAPCLSSRLRNAMFETNESANSYSTLDNWIDWAHNDGFDYPGVFQYNNNNNDTYVHYNWKRAPKFFDVTVHKSNGQPDQQIPHNLEVAPEMAWIKAIDSANNWFVHHKDLTSGYNLILNSSDTETQSNTSGAASFTSTYWTPGNNGVLSGGGNNTYYMAWLWTTLAGISKVGSYTGNGSSQNIDCGFSNGAQMIIIKRYDPNANAWAIIDSARGIVAGNDPVLNLHNTSAEYTSGDDVDPLSSGFIINHDTSSYGLNSNTHKYIFYAVAA